MGPWLSLTIGFPPQGLRKGPKPLRRKDHVFVPVIRMRLEWCGTFARWGVGSGSG